VNVQVLYLLMAVLAGVYNYSVSAFRNTLQFRDILDGQQQCPGYVSLYHRNVFD
jgi:hypothetical protein